MGYLGLSIHNRRKPATQNTGGQVGNVGITSKVLNLYPNVFTKQLEQDGHQLHHVTQGVES